MNRKAICFGCLPGKLPEEKFNNAAKAGFSGVECGPLASKAERQAYLDLAGAYGIKIHSVMNELHWTYPLSDPDPAVRKKSLAGIIASIDTAKFVGADTVLVVPAVVRPDTSYEQAMDRSMASIREILPYAAEQGVRIGIENVWNKFLLSPIEFARYIDGFDNPWVAAYFDVGNIVAYGFPDQWIRSLGQRIQKIHLKGFDAKKHAFTGLLGGTIDWASVMAALNDVDYRGWLTAELSPDPEDGDPEIGLMKISRDMDTILGITPIRPVDFR